MNNFKIAPCGAFVAGALLCSQFFLAGTTPSAHAGSSVGLGTNASFSKSPLQLTLDSRIGYDDNTLDEPDHVDLVLGGRRTRIQTRAPSDSIFINEQLSLSYSLGDSRSNLVIGATAGVTYYFDRPGRDYDLNFGLSLKYRYKLTPRATFEASTFNLYQPEPDFGVVGGQTRRNGDYFYSTNRIALSYRWTPRFSTVTGYDPIFFIYRQQPYSTFQDRTEQYFTQEFRFLIQPTLTLVAEYRFAYISFFNINNDSYSHFVLGGYDYAFSPRLRMTLRAGAEFRTYTDNGARTLAAGFRTIGQEQRNSPFAESSLVYDLSRRSNIALTLRYGLEQGDTTFADSVRETFRLGLAYNQAITARITGYISLFYQHGRYDNGDIINALGQRFGNSYTEDTVDLAVGLRYAINRNFSAEVGYSHTVSVSDFRSPVGAGYLDGLRDYERNRVFAGLRVSF